MGETDLVPPSDEEEFDEWAARKEKKAEESGSHSSSAAEDAFANVNDAVRLNSVRAQSVSAIL